MKRYFIFLGAVCLILASCANIEDNAAETDNSEIWNQEKETRSITLRMGQNLT